MKKVVLITCLMLMGFISKAEEFKAFRVDLGLGYCIPKGGGGVTFALEPKYAITNQISAGFRWEMALMARDLNVNNESASGTLQGNVSYALTGDYFFTETKFRPFAGLGLGLYRVAGAEVEGNVNGGNVSVGDKTNFGALLRAGFDISHFRLGVEYNIAGKGADGGSANYLAILFNVYIGGGRK
ncbi:MAG: hypothetical protein LBR08_00460 [Bacteroidales bacterium]|jgi:outer membrane protein X|nr:hypothetical protein [Bacteroidales bacterium]